ncbi:MAG TPA: hypothetical protein VFX44_05515 [Solirubrobacterales bacterium]|nr:hypothetical protein [Solirubrobacterales bacterium]
MPDQNRNELYRWGGWRQRRRLRRIEPSPDFDKFLVGELDSSEYARLLMRPRKTAGVTLRVKPRGPIAKAREEAVKKEARVHPTVVSGATRVSPEYFRFLREEISSSDYAAALTDCAKLEGIYREPAARFSFPRRGLAEVLVDALRLVFVIGSLAIAIFGLLPVLGPLGAKVVASVAHWTWTMSSIGAILLVVTIQGKASPLLLNLVHFLQRFVSERFAHQRA